MAKSILVEEEKCSGSEFSIIACKQNTIGV
jgi:hypothetical protein